MNSVIYVNNLQKSFDGKEALRNVSFTIPKGETFGFLGPSGSGKTTTIKILTAQLASFNGKVEVFGAPVKKLKKASEMKKIGVLTDNTGLYERLTVEDNLKMFCDLYGVEHRRIDEVLHEVDLPNERKKPINQLSKGMKQRITLARTILHKPELLFLDEPTSALDPVSTERVHRVLKKLNEQGTTIFLTTHDMLEAEKICERVAFLNQGEIQVMDSPSNLRLRYAEPTITLLFADGKKKIIQKDVEGAQIIQRAIEQNQLKSIHSNEPTLGDIFMRVTGKELLV
ncbi:ABC transporter ATP-binding protein [Alkalihalobacillus pseudalcaliphilus]|uniref:ABC transporter ATP-binding protein n=1 Tax=Alkalihalobacillus pseudalcaliphilus TaxID=79884 RepID=UPI00064DCFFF|nr:ABC transporter ATP-binding protein [Alkalihalobacillus pseudalcaliphilus]KMK78058.1 bacitracin ABC transporter ATP-binding protein [Alkalihalobacillus pseudalcaliphilus]